MDEQIIYSDDFGSIKYEYNEFYININVFKKIMFDTLLLSKFIKLIHISLYKNKSLDEICFIITINDEYFDYIDFPMIEVSKLLFYIKFQDKENMGDFDNEYNIILHPIFTKKNIISGLSRERDNHYGSYKRLSVLTHVN